MSHLKHKSQAFLKQVRKKYFHKNEVNYLNIEKSLEYRSDDNLRSGGYKEIEYYEAYAPEYVISGAISVSLACFQDIKQLEKKS